MPTYKLNYPFEIEAFNELEAKTKIDEMIAGGFIDNLPTPLIDRLPEKMKPNAKLWEFLETNPTCNYNPENKDTFKRLVTSHLKAVAKMIKPLALDVSFNPGGIAVSGDAHLKMMLTPTQGIHLFFNLDRLGGVPYITARTISHLGDWTGGPNRTMNLSALETPDHTRHALHHLFPELVRV